MSDGSLSQEEIDALLQGADDLGAAPEAPSAVEGLSREQTEELLDLENAVAGSMAVTLATITGRTVDISNPQLELLTKDAFISQISGHTVQIAADLSDGVAGKHSYVITEEAAKQIAALMMVQEEGELTDMSLSALTEGFNQMTGASLDVVEEKTGRPVKMVGLTSTVREVPEDLETPPDSFVRVRFDLVSNGNSSFIDEIFDMGVALALADAMLAKKGAFAQPAAAPAGKGAKSFQSSVAPKDLFGGGQAQAAGPGPVLGAGLTRGAGMTAGTVGVQPVQFAPLASAEQAGVTGNIGLLMDVSMQLTVELGRTKMLIKDILGMGEGTIVELDKLAGEPVDLLVNGKLIAKGEVVVIDENFGVRVTDIISPMERISNLE